jgi:hypothetical protein
MYYLNFVLLGFKIPQHRCSRIGVESDFNVAISNGFHILDLFGVLCDNSGASITSRLRLMLSG